MIKAMKKSPSGVEVAEWTSFMEGMVAGMKMKK